MLNVKLEVFEGPFDLLYKLIEKHKIDIYDKIYLGEMTFVPGATSTLCTLLLVCAQPNVVPITRIDNAANRFICFISVAILSYSYFS